MPLWLARIAPGRRRQNNTPVSRRDVWGAVRHAFPVSQQELSNSANVAGRGTSAVAANVCPISSEAAVAVGGARAADLRGY